MQIQAHVFVLWPLLLWLDVGVQTDNEWQYSNGSVDVNWITVALLRMKSSAWMLILDLWSISLTKQPQLQIHLQAFEKIFFRKLMHQMTSYVRRDESDKPAQSTGCLLFLFHVSLFSFSCAVLHAILSPTNQQVNFARFQTFWPWFPRGLSSLQLVCSTATWLLKKSRSGDSGYVGHHRIWR